jgi:hypothetical protein
MAVFGGGSGLSACPRGPSDEKLAHSCCWPMRSLLTRVAGVVAILVLVFGGSLGHARAEFRLFVFSGSISSTSGLGLKPGERFSVSYLFDTNTPDTSPYPSIEGQYRQPAGWGILATAGGKVFFASGNGYYGSKGFIIRVQPAAYTAQAGPQGGPPTGQPDITILFSNPSPVLSSNALPSSIDLGAWHSNYAAVLLPTGGYFTGTLFLF